MEEWIYFSPLNKFLEFLWQVLCVEEPFPNTHLHRNVNSKLFRSCFRSLLDPLLHHAGVWWIAALLHGAGTGAVPSLWVPNHLETNMPSAQRWADFSADSFLIYSHLTPDQCHFVELGYEVGISFSVGMETSPLCFNISLK